MSFQSMLAADATNVFLNASELAQTIQLYPGGIAANAVAVTALVFLEEQEQFQGPRIDDRRGAMQLRFGRIELSTSVNVVCDKRREARDAFLINGELWQAERPIGTDAGGLQAIEISREEHVMSRTSRIPQ